MCPVEKAVAFGANLSACSKEVRLSDLSMIGYLVAMHIATGMKVAPAQSRICTNDFVDDVANFWRQIKETKGLLQPLEGDQGFDQDWLRATNF